MPDEQFYDSNTRRVESRKTQDAETTAKATGVQAGFDSSKLKGAKTAAPEAPGKPSRSAYPEGIGGQSQYDRAVRAWRAKGDPGKEQRKALGG